MKLSTAYNFIDEKPYKDIVLNHDELLQHAYEMSNFHAQSGTAKKRNTFSLLSRVFSNGHALQNAYSQIAEYVQKTKDMVPAAEWFLDNYYILKEIPNSIKTNLPRKYELQLPRLVNGAYQGYPRVYTLMVELIEHTDSQVSGESLRDYVDMYQKQVPLTSGELWAIPIMLKVVLFENIRRLVEQVLEIQNDRKAAEKWLTQFQIGDHSVEEWEIILKSVQHPVSFSPAFGERLLKRIRELGIDGLPILQWLDHIVAKQDTTIENLAKIAHQQQAACQVSIGHAIESLRYLGAEDWPRFFEDISLIERVLQTDPSDVYTQMDFESRDVYRHEVEKIARRFRIPETIIARKILEQSKAKQELPENHVGYYLLGKGRQELESKLEKEWGIIHNTWCRGKRLIKNSPQTIYFGGIIAFLALFLYLIFSSTNLTSPYYFFLMLIVSIAPLSSIAISIVNWLITKIILPGFLPKLDLSGGIPVYLRTMVVIPTLLPNVTKVKELIEQLEVYYLANQDPNLHFAILGDYIDARTEILPEDHEILESAIKGIENLNQKYGNGKFYLFHRHRLWNTKEETWLGWERKRGKLIEFNRLLRRSGPTSYSTQIGDLSVLSNVRYVITLDADTQLLRGNAKKLIGSIAHPLQAARLSADGQKVIQGYGILQPRVGVSVTSAFASTFSRIFTGNVGIDPYTAAISDVYQDLFEEGIFTGKGIYDVEIFHRMTGDTFPENTILSHDLIEGLYARTGLVTDIELIDGFPAKYFAHARRLHRWVRGDWQIVRWLFKAMPFYSKWKILDNLRRSLNAPLEFLLVILAFSILPGEPWFWAGIVVIELLLPTLLCFVGKIINPISSKGDIRKELLNGLIQSLLHLIFLPFMALTMSDAIIKALYRQFISHKHLLEWETAADTEKRLDLSFRTSWSQMWPAELLVLFTTVLITVFNPARLVLVTPLILLWISAPWIAYKISLPLKKQGDKLNENERKELRLWARRIWAFFEDFVGPEDNWLPPDNVQVDPENGVAHRTSPTNIGLALLANLAARDMGYLSLVKLHERIENTLSTMEGLERWNGHLYNWYDTRQKTPLLPLYVSTVDSGNLVLYLLTLKQGLEDNVNSPLLSRKLAIGLKDSVEILQKELSQSDSDNQVILEQLGLFEAHLQRFIADPISNSDVNSWYNLLLAWSAEWNNPTNDKGVLEKEDISYWKERITRMVNDFHKEVLEFYPWLAKINELNSQDRDLLQTLSLNHSIYELKEFYVRVITKGSEVFKADCQIALDKIAGFIGHNENLKLRLEALALVMDFRPLYDEHRQLFSIGFRIQDGTLDKSYYDLLASEARQASFIAIAKGDIPLSHWFRLGRNLTKVRGYRGLVSWSGTMFEFLMPLLVMRNYEGTLLDETYRSVVEIQKFYANDHKAPWGISESGFYAFDAQMNYQYKAFGVPGLGLKRGLIQDLVISPYSTFLALMVMPVESAANLKTMQECGFAGRYGLYEAIDFTPDRLAVTEKFRIIKSFMAHHQGMSFLSLTNVLENNILQQRLHTNPLVQSVDLLLQERIPDAIKFTPPIEERVITYESKQILDLEGKRTNVLTNAETIIPVAHFISNGQYSVMLTNSGSGFSNWGKLSVSRWYEDVTKDNWGMYFYIQNLNSGNVWSATSQPWGDAGSDYKVVYAPDKVEFSRKDGNITTRTEVVVSPEEPVEIRRISLTNHSQHNRTLELTSYFEVVLATVNDDLAHPAFSNLFIQTEFTHQALLASRRPRKGDKNRIWLMHTIALEGESVGTLQYETDRARFIGRGRTLAYPKAMEPNQPLSNTVGQVLDPIMSLRQRVLLRPGQTVKVSYATGVAESREDAIRLAEKYRNPSTVSRAHELAWSHSQMELRHLNLTPAEANQALSLASYVIFNSPARRANADIISKNVKGQSSLWPYSISGDLPIVLLLIQEHQHLDFVKDFLKVHEYWHIKGLIADLVILNEDESGYVQSLQDTLRDLVAVGPGRELINRPGGIFILQKKHLNQADINLLFTVSRIVFSGQDGSCFVQLRKKAKAISNSIKKDTNDQGNIKRTSGEQQIISGSRRTLDLSLLYANGFGGFDEESREYVIELSLGNQTPLPWINVIANPNFGFQISERGSSYTWSGNSRENKLTSWSNDPVQDPSSEVIYLRDEISGEFWSITPAPVRESGSYTVRHGQGYTYFQYQGHELKQELLLFVPMDDPIKIIQVRVKNDSLFERKLTATYFVEMVLGTSRILTAPYLVTVFSPENDAVIISNAYEEEFFGRRAFLTGKGGVIQSYTGDRTEFIGRNRDLSYPVGMEMNTLPGTMGAGLDPCASIRLEFSLKSGEEKVIHFYLGEGKDDTEITNLLSKYQDSSKVQQALDKVKSFWHEILDRIQVETPDKSMNLLMNSWLLYQTVVCRLWARSAFYQSGGAFGFRDQLQDVMALAVVAPEWTKNQILKHCAHQFKEGDVQHWWHPERSKGIRTKFSDDFLWLPFVTADYLEHTKDYCILDENIFFLEDAPLEEDEDELYSIPKISDEEGSVYEHCIRAIENGLRFGEHGLPLIGTGDWNDGLSRIGRKGKGESVWLGWFLYLTLQRFAEICKIRLDDTRAERYKELAKRLQEDLERYGWDGGWYRRAYFDDGTPLGSSQSEECQIDAIAQSWAVISGAAKPSRAQDAMLALEHYLWKRDEGVLLLLTPPFDNSRVDPGYIKGYIPGVRENGGQYTHGAIWAVLAFCIMGNGDKAYELFQMLNPINHSRTESEVARYKTEPYVMSADVYAIPPHVGRGGWSWYTGAAGWMYQAGLEGILGFHLSGDELKLNPCLPKHWPGYKLNFKYKKTEYKIEVDNSSGNGTEIKEILVDGELRSNRIINLTDDRNTHIIRVNL